MRKICLLFILWACVCLTGNAGTQASETKKDTIEIYIEKQLDNRCFTVDVSMAYPMRGRSIPLTSSYSLKMKNDSVDVYLPYFGRAYSVPYGGGKGLHFQSEITGFCLEKKKKGYEVRFSSKTEEDVFDFYLDISTGGSVTVSVTMHNRQPIRYSGEIVAEEMQ